MQPHSMTVGSSLAVGASSLLAHHPRHRLGGLWPADPEGEEELPRRIEGPTIVRFLTPSRCGNGSQKVEQKKAKVLLSPASITVPGEPRLFVRGPRGSDGSEVSERLEPLSKRLGKLLGAEFGDVSL